MGESVFGDEFDMEAYLAQRSLEIRDLADRRLFKEVVDKLFLDLYRHTQQEYKELENRVFGEVQSTQRDYAIYIGLIDAAHYDATDPFLKPIIMADTEQREIPLEDLQGALAENRPYHLFHVYLETPFDVVKRFQDSGGYSGLIRTDQGEYKASFSVTLNKAYLQKIEALYHIFIANYRQWTTVCGGYLYKIFDVALESMEREIPSNEIIQEIKVDFGQYASRIKYNIIPLWNLNLIKEKTSTYPEPCMDKTNYDHRIFSYKLEASCQYLVTNTDIEVTNIRRLDGDLIISCPEENPCQWLLYQVNQYPQKYKPMYPLLSNRSKESFAGSLGDAYRRSVKTRAEVARLIEAFEVNGYVTFQSVELMERGAEKSQTYDMDYFISDELRVGDAHQVMDLTFQARDPDNVLNMDVMSFLVTQVQKLFPEYRCQGRLVQEAEP